ncbi:MAG: tetratricopeptide repeat protein [Bacteroidota bacterium]|nr:tetratricopeptide repeat protein [Bacteroidota bacterium]
MKRNFLFLVLTLFVINVSVFGAKESQGVSYYKAGFPQVAKPLLLSEYATDSLTRSETCFYLGNIYFGENKPDSAAVFFNRGANGKQVDGLNSIGLAMLKIKTDPKSAELEIQSVLKLSAYKKNPDYYIAAANAYLVNGLIDQAVVYQDKAKNIKPKYASLAVLSGDIELARKNVGNACSNYELAILYDGNCKEAYVKYARAYKNVNSTLAIEMLNRLKVKEPSFLLTDKELADIYYTNNDFEKAAQLYDSYLKSGNSNIQDLIKYAMTLFFNHDFAKSLQVVNEGLVKAPQNPAFNRLAMYNNTDLKQYEDAIKSADRLFNHSDNPDFTYLDYRYYGQALHETKQYDLAIIQYKKALEADSTKTDLWKDISDMYNEKDDFNNAIASYIKYESSLTEEKNTPDVVIALGKLYYGLGNKDSIDVQTRKKALLKADSVFAQVAKMEPTGYRGNFWRARTNFGLDPETTQGLAKPFYEQTVSMLEAKADPKFNPVLIECYRYLGFYYLLKSDYSVSSSYWNKILAIDPTNATALKGIEGIKRALKSKK